VTDLTFTATPQNTQDSKFVAMPQSGTPSNWLSPIDYSKGDVHVRLEVLEKPSAKKTSYAFCFEGAASTETCMGLAPAETGPGTFEKSQSLPTFWNYAQFDFSQGVAHVAIAVKDENQNLVQGDASFFPTKLHVTITLVSPGATYMPPQAPAS